MFLTLTCAHVPLGTTTLDAHIKVVPRLMFEPARRIPKHQEGATGANIVGARILIAQRNEGMNPGVPLKETTSWMIHFGVIPFLIPGLSHQQGA